MPSFFPQFSAGRLRGALLSAERKQAKIWRREWLLSREEGTGLYPPLTPALPFSKSTDPFCPASQATSERKAQQAKGQQTPPRFLHHTVPSPREQKEGRGEETTADPSGLGIWLPWNWKAYPSSEDQGVFCSLHVLAMCLSAPSAKAASHVA